MAKIKIDAQMFSWLAKNVTRRAVQFAALPEPEKSKNQREVDHWQELKRKVVDAPKLLDPQSNVILSLNRNDLRFIQTMVLDQMVHLNSHTSPAYAERVKRNPELAEEYKPYIEKAAAIYLGLSDFMDILNEVI